MAGIKGRSGTNKGKDKLWADALRVAVNRQDESGKNRLLKIAEKCVALAETGDIQSIREIGDRLDGKAHQTSETTAEVVHRYVARVPAKAKSTEQWQKEYVTQTIQ